MTALDRRLMMPTDVATIVIFHPDDLAHTAAWPIAWYAEPFIYPTESAAARLVAWSTRADGAYAVRLTDGPLSEREARYAGPQWTFPLRVRHGRVFLDNTDALPGQAQMTQTTDHPDYWIEIPNGEYAVTVTAIQWDAEPGSEAPGADPLPNYVVRFAPRAGRDIPIARRPPDLECRMDALASDEVYDAPQRAMAAPDYDRPYPAFIAPDLMRPGQSVDIAPQAPITAGIDPADDTFAIFDTIFAAITRLEAGAPAMLVKCHGHGGSPNEPTRYSFRSLHPVRIAGIEGMFRNGRFGPTGMTGLFRRRPRAVPPDALPAIQIAPLPASGDDPVTVPPEALQARLMQDLTGNGPLARHLGGIAGYQALRLGAMTRPEAILGFALDQLPLPVQQRLDLIVLPPHAQSAGLDRAYAHFAGATD